MLSVCALPGMCGAHSAEPLVLNKIRSGANLQGNLAFVNLDSGQVAAGVPVGNEQHEVAISADYRFAVVTNTGSYGQPGNTLSLIDVANRAELHRVDLG
jgi:DNA-binding beta-propeller fold protein YncE